MSFFSSFGAVKIEVQNWLNLFFWLFWSCNHFKIAFFAWDLRLSKRYLSIKVPFPFFATTILFLFLLYYPAKASCVVHNAHLIQHEFIVRRDETFTPPALLQSFLSRYACIYSYSLLFSFLPFSNCILHLMHPKLTLQLSRENNNSFVKLRNLDSKGVNVIIE